MAAVKTRNREGKSVKEKQLFHGTSPEAVTAICKQNFDWRLHGKNATMYGEGSYFAVNASYSHNYAKADTDSCRYMFLADVLVGSYTKGKSSFRRPPPLQSWNPESDLFDSCVDDEVHPTIFVVFDTDQFYPAYIIKYSVRSLSSVPAVQHFVSPSWPSTAAQVSPAVYTPSAYPVSQGRGKDKCSLM